MARYNRTASDPKIKEFGFKFQGQHSTPYFEKRGEYRGFAFRASSRSHEILTFTKEVRGFHGLKN